jgi:hypothetical protein
MTKDLMREYIGMIEGMYDQRPQQEHDQTLNRLYGQAFDLNRELQAMPMSSVIKRELDDALRTVMSYLKSQIDQTTTNLYPRLGQRAA